MCDEKCSVSSASLPVSRLITPPGTSDECSTSEKVMAVSGDFSEQSTTQVLPPAITGAITEISPASGCASGATTEITPVGSGTLKLK